MNIKNNSWLILFLWILGGTSCQEDKGNYDYQPIAWTYVSEGFSQNGYQLAVGDILEIIPTITNSGDMLGDTARYEYWWTAQRELNRPGMNNQKYIIGRGPSLYYQIDLPDISPDKYLIVFHMKDRETQIEWTRATSLKITGSLQEGWLLLCDKNGRAEMNMYARKSDGEIVLVKGMLEKSGFPYLRGPRKISYENNGVSIDGNKIWILTDEATGWLTKQDYQWKDDQLVKYKMINPVGNNHVSRDIVQIGMASFLLDDPATGGFQARDFRNMGSVFGGNIAIYDKGVSSFRIAPYVGGDLANIAVGGGMLYDADNKQFIWCPIVNSSSPEESVRLSDDERWAVGKKMIYMQSVKKNSRTYALFEDTEAADIVWEYELGIESKFDMSSMSFISSPKIWAVRKLENASHLRSAKLIAYQMSEGYLYYVDDKTLYTHYNKQDRPLKTFDGEVTALHSQFMLGNDPVSLQTVSYLLLATYGENQDADESKWGNLYFFSADNSNPTNVVLRNSVPGVGKVVDIDYQIK